MNDVSLTNIPPRKSPKSATRHYHLETLRPIVCLTFVVPILFVYELGIILLGNESLRNGVDVWLRWILEMIGAGEILLLPLVTCGALLVLHHRRNDEWRIRLSVLVGMLLESLILAAILLFAAKAHHLLLLEFASTHGHTTVMQIDVAPNSLGWHQLVAFCGAGLYEELAFRLLMLSSVILIVRKTGFNTVPATLFGIVLVSLLFAAVHYQILNPGGVQFDWPTFAVRTLASVFFCVVYLMRGFGVAVGTHVTYDVLTQV